MAADDVWPQNRLLDHQALQRMLKALMVADDGPQLTELQVIAMVRFATRTEKFPDGRHGNALLLTEEEADEMRVVYRRLMRSELVWDEDPLFHLPVLRERTAEEGTAT